jgi:hypothetical protein
MSININLGSLGPFMKAIAPAVLALVGAGTNALISGSIDKQTLVIAITGVVAAIITYLVPNSPKPVPAPAPAPVAPPVR